MTDLTRKTAKEKTNDEVYSQGSVTQAAAGEVGYLEEEILTSNVSVVDFTNEVDLGIEVTLTEGTWMLGYDISASFVNAANQGTSAMAFKIYDSLDNLVSGTAGHVGYTTGNPPQSSGRPSISRTTVVFVPEGQSETYRIRYECNVNGTPTITVYGEGVTGNIDNPDNSSKIRAIRIR